MSEKIFIKAQNYVNRVTECWDLISRIKEIERDTKSLKINNKYWVHNYKVVHRPNPTSYNSVQLWHRMYCGSRNSYYVINIPGINWHQSITRDLIEITEFREDLDFQLMTLLDDTELFEYYTGCLLYTLGYSGSVYKNIHANTFNALKNHLNYFVERNL